MPRSRILGTGKALPSGVLTNHDLEKRVATSDQWIIERTGIRERRIIEAGRNTSDLAAEAGARALAAAELPASALDGIIVGTVTPDMPMPASAVLVQAKLGATCPSFDVSAACAGFIYGLSIGDAFIRSGAMKRVLVVGVEVLSRVLDWTDRNTCVLFGDGAGAVVLGLSDDDHRGVLSTHLYADGNFVDLLKIPAGGTASPASAHTLEAGEHYVKMNGKGIFVHAVRNIARAMTNALEANGMKPSDVDIVVPHQANIRIIEALSEKLGIPLSKFYVNLAKYGNTSSASIPIALDDAIHEGRVKQGDIVMFGALGAGLSWGSALLRW